MFCQQMDLHKVCMFLWIPLKFFRSISMVYKRFPSNFFYTWTGMGPPCAPPFSDVTTVKKENKTHQIIGRKSKKIMSNNTRQSFRTHNDGGDSGDGPGRHQETQLVHIGRSFPRVNLHSEARALREAGGWVVEEVCLQQHCYS